jgi:tRNA (adenine57-N1/adenine58-N1)-methyltransferase
MIQYGDNVQLVFDPTKRKNARGSNIITTTLRSGKRQNTYFGEILHDELIGHQIGDQLKCSNGTPYHILRPTIAESTLSFPRGAAIIYPKDAAYIVTYGDIFPGARVLECGLGSGSMTCSLLRSVAGPSSGEASGEVVSIEQREDFLGTATKNVNNFFNDELPAKWSPMLSSFEDFLKSDTSSFDPFDRCVLDLLNPWDYLEALHSHLKRGAVVTIYITTVPQITSLASEFERLAHDSSSGSSPKYINIELSEVIRRPWKIEDLSIRPEHQGILHSGFILTCVAV